MEWDFDTIEAMKYVKVLAVILMLTLSQICLCLIAAGISDYLSRPAAAAYAEQVVVDREIRDLLENPIHAPEMDSPMPNPSAWRTHLAESRGANRSR